MKKILVVLLASSLLLSGCSMEDNIAVNILNNIKGDTTESTESSEVQEQEQTNNIDNYIPSVEEAAKEQGLVYNDTITESTGISEEIGVLETESNKDEITDVMGTDASPTDNNIAKVTGYQSVGDTNLVYVTVNDTDIELKATKEDIEKLKKIKEDAGVEWLADADIVVKYEIDSNGDAILTKVIK